jgi:muconolactone delta-isomerase
LWWKGKTRLQVGGRRKEGAIMEVFVKYEVFDTITDREQVLRVRQVVGAQFQRIQESGKVKAMRIFADARGGFILLDLDSPEELFDLLGAPIFDHFHVETHPVISVEKLAEFFERDAAAG